VTGSFERDREAEATEPCGPAYLAVRSRPQRGHVPVALKVRKGYLKGRVLVIPDDRTFVLGSSLESDLVVFGKGVRDRHCSFIPLTGGGHKIKKVHKDAQLEVDGDEIEDERPLVAGDEIAFGAHRLEYEPHGEMVAIASPLEEPFGDDILASATPCASCGDRIGPDRQGFDPKKNRASLRALKVGDDVVCPRCVDRRLDAARDLGAYRILRKTGVNELEVTYLGLERETGRRVALRILKADRATDPKIARRYLIRALVGHQLRHPNFLQVLAVGANKGIRFVVMEQQDKAFKLEKVLRERSPIPILDALYVVNQLAEVIRVGRELGLLIARKPRTGVLITRESWLKVQSYDITRSLEQRVMANDAFKDLLKRSGDTYAATPQEQLPDGTDAREFPPERVEVFGIGRIYFQLLTGFTFDLKLAKDALIKSLERNKNDLPTPRPKRDRNRPLPGPPSLDHVPRPGLLLLARLLARDEEQRLPSLDAVTRASKEVFRVIENDPRLAEAGIDATSEAIEMSDEEVSADEGGIAEPVADD
jgi:serine/threonine protein kinase